MGIRTLALTGGSGGQAKELADRTICVSVSDETPRIQETLLIVEHLLCEWIEAALFPSLDEPGSGPAEGTRT
jgi:D-sedoheptulose 7-phosphate isomerase